VHHECSKMRILELCADGVCRVMVRITAYDLASTSPESWMSRVSRASAGLPGTAAPWSSSTW